MEDGGHPRLRERRTLLQNYRDTTFSQDSVKKKSVKYLEGLAQDFWCSTEERVQRNVETLRQQVYAEKGFDAMIGANTGVLNASLGASFKANGDTEHVVEVTTETRDRIQHVVNQSELPQLKEILRVIHNEVLDSPQHHTYLLIDDLDQYWVDESIRLTLLRCLFEAVIDMATKVPNLKILVALRTNIFVQLDYGSQKYGLQEEKIEDLILSLKWTRNDLETLLDQRVNAASVRWNINPPWSLSSILPNANSSRDPVQTIIDLTLMRPRDAILYLNTAIELAEGRPRLSWDHLKVAEEIYSEKRLKALRDEWKDPYFHVDKVLEKFRKKQSLMTWEELTPILDSIAIDVLYETSFEGGQWLEPLCQSIYQLPLTASLHDRYYALINVLFEIGFLGIGSSMQGRRPTAAISGNVMYSYLLNEPLTEHDLRADITFVIHPAFRRFLQMSVRWGE